jgi:exopolyphosphatase/guanosine-5'-triphosphate,3'-diphosphate pyrophosphatase
MIGRVVPGADGPRVEPLDSIKRTVRLAAGLRSDGTLDPAAQQRGLEALSVFGARLRSFAPAGVRAVATNTLRVARNAGHFLVTAEAALGFPIEVISGHEEARLIYLGAAHALPADGLHRLVVDIGGGSTECIVGANRAASVLDSAGVGCVGLSQRFFVDGKVTPALFDAARGAARARFEALAQPFHEHGWQYAVGTSGTAKALSQIARASFGSETLDRKALDAIHEALLVAGDAEKLELEGLKPDRRPVLAGGLAVMMAAFDEFGLDSIGYCSGALRHGVLHDLIERNAGADQRSETVMQMMQKYGVNTAHARRVADTALALFGQAARAANEELARRRQLLEWAALLAECGKSISHDSYHKHSAYILGWADMPGFSKPEQSMLALLALGQCGGLRKLRGRVNEDLGWVMIVALRIATLLHRSQRSGEALPLPALFLKRGVLRLELQRSLAKRHPITHAALTEEAALWSEAKVFEQFEYQTP